MSKPIGISEYKLTPKLPKELCGQLPNPRQLAGLFKEVEDNLEKDGRKIYLIFCIPNIIR